MKANKVVTTDKHCMYVLVNEKSKPDSRLQITLKERISFYVLYYELNTNCYFFLI